MKNKLLITKVIIISIGLISIPILILTISAFTSENVTKTKSNSESFFEIRTPQIPKEINLFGEKIPLESFDIYERLEREMIVNTYMHSATLLVFKRASRWFPVIEPILKENKLPDDFKYLAVAESNLENVISSAGATGFWQLMKPAAEKYGLEVNDQVDERYHIEKSTKAACDYLNEAYKKFGNWTLAAASYNAGLNGVEKWSRIQQSRNFYNLLLNTETSRFIFRIAALKIIYENPEEYGFVLSQEEKYSPLKTTEIILDSSVADFTSYANSLGINYKILKYYNPWLRDTGLNNKMRKTYIIKVPAEGSIKIFPELN